MTATNKVGRGEVGNAEEESDEWDRIPDAEDRDKLPLERVSKLTVRVTGLQVVEDAEVRYEREEGGGVCSYETKEVHLHHR